VIRKRLQELRSRFWFEMNYWKMEISRLPSSEGVGVSEAWKSFGF
jgi:hypothetical protein